MRGLGEAPARVSGYKVARLRVVEVLTLFMDMAADPHNRLPTPTFTLPETRRSPVGLLVSVLFHVGLVLLIAGGVLGGQKVLTGLGTGFGPGPAGGGGGGGGSRVSYIELPSLGAAAPKAPEVTTEPKPEVVTPPPVESKPEPTPVPPPPVPAVSRPAPANGATTLASRGDGAGTGAGTDSGNGGGSGGGTGGGTGTGNGSGVGPGTGGDSSSVTPPQLRYWVPPTDKPPKALRGQSLNVTFWVKADGTVERFRLDPEIEDQDYREKFAEILSKTRFRPARTSAGTAIPYVVSMQFTLSAK
jgi:protein TonB